MATRLTPDLCVIGATSAALTIAAGVAARGHRVVLIARDGFGADRLAYGAVPLTALQAAAQHAHDMRAAAAFGIAPADPQIDFRAVQRHVGQVLKDAGRDWSLARFAALGVHIIGEDARFIDRATIAAGDVEVRARRFVIATASVPTVPDFKGLDEIDHLTEDDITALSRRPSRLVVVGSGETAIGYAQAFRRLGSDVALIAPDAILPGEDTEHVELVLRRLRGEGVEISERSTVAAVERRGKTGVRVHVRRGGTSDTIDGTHLLIALGRKASTEALALDKAGDSRVLLLDPAGNETAEQVRFLAEQLAGSLPADPKKIAQRPLLPRLVRSDPPIASVGLSEAEAAARYKRLSVLRWPYARNAQAIAQRRIEGSIKILAEPAGRILGVSIAGTGAAGMIGFWALAISRSMTLADIAGEVPPDAAIAEIGKSAALSYLAARTRRPKAWRLPALFRRSG